jgi:hypothetical protein
VENEACGSVVKVGPEVGHLASVDCFDPGIDLSAEFPEFATAPQILENYISFAREHGTARE